MLADLRCTVHLGEAARRMPEWGKCRALYRRASPAGPCPTQKPGSALRGSCGCGSKQWHEELGRCGPAVCCIRRQKSRYGKSYTHTAALSHGSTDKAAYLQYGKSHPHIAALSHGSIDKAAYLRYGKSYPHTAALSHGSTDKAAYLQYGKSYPHTAASSHGTTDKAAYLRETLRMPQRLVKAAPIKRCM